MTAMNQPYQQPYQQPYGQPTYDQPGTVYPLRRPATSVGRMGGAEGAGVLMLLLGAWAGLVPFIGPIWGWSADGTASWTWTNAHAWLFVVPGAVAFLGALMILGGGIGTRAGGTSMGGLLGVLAGAWLVVGPVAWPVLTGAHFFHGYGTLTELSYWIGYSLGPGLLIAVLGAYALGRPKLLVPTAAPTVAAPVA